MSIVIAQPSRLDRRVQGIEMVFDGPGAGARDGVHIVFAAEKVQTNDEFAAPDVADSESEIGLINATWPPRFEIVLGTRLHELIDSPEA